ncbi:hypothetical protein GCM10009765_56960 [Fodinicola feengrottensis]|uniref:Uncharacterized protein n=1 Tax=Fodinicola feengrottensis TaxID=435914 RepID=A0ABN2I7T7_9ACTN
MLLDPGFAEDFRCLIGQEGLADLSCALVIPYDEIPDVRFWLTHPSRGFLDESRMFPPESEFARYVADCWDNSPAFTVKESRSDHVNVIWAAPRSPPEIRFR